MNIKQLQKVLQVVVLVLVTHSHTWAERPRRLSRNTPKSPCTSRGVEWVRDPSSCSKYVVCGHGAPMATMLCPNSLVWSVQVKNCVLVGSRWDDCTVDSKETDLHLTESDNDKSRNRSGKENEWSNGADHRSRRVTETNSHSSSEGVTSTSNNSNGKRRNGADHRSRDVSQRNSHKSSRGVTRANSNNNNKRRIPVTDRNNDKDDKRKTITNRNRNRNDNIRKTVTDWSGNRYDVRSVTDRDRSRSGDRRKTVTDWNNNYDDRSETVTDQNKNDFSSKLATDPDRKRNNDRRKTVTDWINENYDGSSETVTERHRNGRYDVRSKTVTDWNNENYDDRSETVTDWNNDDRSETVTDWNSNSNENRRRAVTSWKSNSDDDRHLAVTEWNKRRTGGAADNQIEDRRPPTEDWKTNNRDSSGRRDVGHTSSPSSSYSHRTSAPPVSDYTTSGLPRWRWAEWAFTRPNYDNYDDNYSAESEEYPPAFKETPTNSEKYPMYTEVYPTDREKYPTDSDDYPSYEYINYDDYEDYETDSQDYLQATAHWLRTTPQRTTKQRTTTFKSPFAPFDTTRRRPVIANDGENDHRRSNHVMPKHGMKEDAEWNGNDEGKNADGWLKKSPWWRTRSPGGQPRRTTPRPWWARDNVLPWLTPSSMWVPQTHPATTTPLPTTVPHTTTTTPSTTTTTTTTSTTRPLTTTTTTTTSTTWYTIPESTVTELPVSPTIISWSPPSDDYYGYGEEGGDENDVEWMERTTGGVKKPTHHPSQMTPSLQRPEDPAAWQRNNDTPAYHPECGVAVTNMIVGGLPASEGRWPWVVSLRLTWARRHVCGGTLVHPQWIVTAAHCVFGSQFEEATDWRAVFGNVQPTLTSDVKKQLKIDLIVRHPEFVNGGNYPNDIAMMRLEKPVDVSGFHVRHACLPSRDNPFLSNSECWIMGWGETKGFEEQSVLQELVVKIRRNQACAARWGWKRILNSHVCVGNGDGGACNGDSGGPLVCLRDGYYYLVGVTSWGVSGCQTTGYPSVFSRVSFYEKWIESVIQTYSTFHFPLTK